MHKTVVYCTVNHQLFQRYLNSSVFFKDGGPIFIFLGGSSAISEYYLMSGQMFDMASQHDGYMFYLEHRYYGKSHATEYSWLFEFLTE